MYAFEVSSVTKRSDTAELLCESSPDLGYQQLMTIFPEKTVAVLMRQFADFQTNLLIAPQLMTATDHQIHRKTS